MTTHRGFHPGRRLVHRLGRISPQHQIQLLGVISLVIMAVIVGSVIGALAPTHRSLENSTHRLVPATRKLDVARASYGATAAALQKIIDPLRDARATGITQLAALNSSGEAAWTAYVKIAAHLPHERALQQKFVADRHAALASGSVFVTQISPTAASLSDVTARADTLRSDLNQVKALYETRVQGSLRAAADDVASTQRTIEIVSVIALVVMLVAFGVVARSARSRDERLEHLDRDLHREYERNELDARLQRSLEMARTEPAAYQLIGRALQETAAGLPSELLVADSSRAHFRQVANTEADDAGETGCPVTAPADCPAAIWGQTQIWASSTALDACPYLRSRPSGECSAVCVPVSIGGNTVGVVHTTAPDGNPPDERTVVKIELVARKVGDRVGMMRAFQRSQTQAHTDPLTGLMNRRSLEEKVRAMTEDGTSYCAVYADLDHFKQLNDLHGHDAGDQALRLFARVLRDSVRPHDLTARYGGEEFVVVLPDCPISDAYAVINRLRDALRDAQASVSTPQFTASFGITAARPENTFSETLELADAALLKAKAAGRDRIVISGADGAPADGPDHVVSA
ncbi:MAG TPA: GGDEF domain-containing protein [Acidimicrobiia bacterium]